MFLHFVTLPQFLVAVILGVGYGFLFVHCEDIQERAISVAWSGVFAMLWFSLCVVYNRWTGFVY